MKVVLDADILSLLLRPDGAAPPRDHVTGREVSAWRARLGELVTRVDEERGSIVIPTPTLGELLVRAGRATGALLREIEARRAFQVQPFDLRAAVELAAMARQGGGGGPAEARARQVVAVAKVNGATRLYSDDADIRAAAARHGLAAAGLATMPLPAQGRLDLGDPQA